MATIIAALWFRGGSRPAEAAPAAPASAAAPGTPPDLSTMSPREQFDRLYNRIMTAAEAGDTGSVARFSPMALSAYGLLDDRDADARYHAAMIRRETGDLRGAAALADTILADNPRHLLGLAIRGSVAEARGDRALLERTRREFLAGWDAETAAGRQEYRDHQVILDRFRDEARRASGEQRP